MASKFGKLPRVHTALHCISEIGDVSRCICMNVNTTKLVHQHNQEYTNKKNVHIFVVII